MRLTRIIVSLTLGSLCVLACRSPPPKRPNFRGENSEPSVQEGDLVPPGPVTIDPAAQAGGVDIIFSEDNAACESKPAPAGRKSLRLLTREEYTNTVKDILKTTRDPSGNIPRGSAVNGFENNVETNLVSSDHLSAYLDAGIVVADEAKAKLQTLVGCTEDAGESCAQKVISVLGPKFYRRPLTAEDTASSLAAYKKGVAVSAREGMTMLIASFLTSPSFLYRSEIGDATGKLDGYEVASSLSFFFWGTSPDDALLASAANGMLLTEAGMKAEALRLWKDPRSRFVTDTFAHGWLENRSVLNASKDASLTNIFTPAIQKAMEAEGADTFDYLMRLPTATFESLYASDYTIGPPALATFYGGQSVVEGSVTKIKFPGQPRKGLVTLGGVMASHSRPDESHPVKRGDFVLQKMLCFVPPPTPKGLEVVVPAKDPTKTTRERFAVHSTSPACAGCHIKLDGVGFGLEDYDTLGRYRAMENGKTIDASGTMVGVDGKDTKFSGGGSLAEEMSKSSEVKRCFTLQWYRYAHGRAMVASDPDICATRNLAVKFSKGEIPLTELLIKIITDSSYTKRGP